MKVKYKIMLGDISMKKTINLLKSKSYTQALGQLL